MYEEEEMGVFVSWSARRLEKQAFDGRVLENLCCGQLLCEAEVGA